MSANNILRPSGGESQAILLTIRPEHFNLFISRIAADTQLMAVILSGLDVCLEDIEIFTIERRAEIAAAIAEVEWIVNQKE